MCIETILNIVSTKLWLKNIIKKKDRDAFVLQNIENNRVAFLYFDSFYSLILADNIVVYLKFVIIHVHVKILKYMAITAQRLQ